MNACVHALEVNPPVIWPAYQVSPKAVWRWIARSIGYGLVSYSDVDRQAQINTTYTRIVVKHTFGFRGGVPFDNRTWVGWIRETAVDA
jgi:hypothetical protein